MKWIEYLENKNVPFNLHILEPNDSIIFPPSSENDDFILVVYGLVILLKIFTNGETICKQILSKDHRFFYRYNSSLRGYTYYYRATAIIKTGILTCSLKGIYKNYITKSISTKFLYHFQYTNYTNIISILCNRNTKKRIVQLLLQLAQEFGKYKNNIITIPFHLSHQTISLIIGSNRINVTRIMNKLKQKKVISYNKKELIIHSIVRLIQV